MKRLAQAFAFGVVPTLVVSASSAAPVQLASFDSFTLDAIYGSWGAPFATLTSAPDRFVVRSHNYGSGYKYLGGEFDAAGNDTLKLEVTVSEGVAGCLVDLVDADNNGIAFRFYGLTPGNGTNGTNDYTMTMKLSDATYFTGTGVLDTTRISQMHIEIDPGPTSDFYTASFNDVSLITSAVASSWTGAAGNAWSAAGNWGSGVPNSVDATATFAAIASGQFNVNVDGAKIAGTINFDNAAGFTLSGSGPITLNTSSGSAGLNVVNGSHTISAPLAMNSDTTVNVAPAASVLTTSALQTTTHAITKTGAGNFAANNVRASALTINAGTVTILTNGGDSGASKVATLAIAGGATPTASLDLKNNDLIVTGGTYAAITNAISKARNAGAWNQPGLTSSTAAAATPKNKTLGTLTGAEFHTAQGAGATFDGFTVANSDILVKFTYYGDVDFNGLVDFDDYSRIDAGFNNNRTGWANGDVDYNGIVDFDDYSLIDQAFNTQSGTLRRAMSYLDGSDRSDAGMNAPSLQLVQEHLQEFGEQYAAGFLASVPEPGSIALLGLPVLAGMIRPRRRR